MAEDNSTIDYGMLLEKLNNEKIIENIPTMLFVCIINCFGIAGNTMTILFYMKKKRTTSTLLLIVLATTDLITCVILFNQIIGIRYTFTFTNIAGCKIMIFLSYLFLTSSIFMLFLICIDRHRKMCRPYGWQFSIRSCKFTIAGLLAFATLLSAKQFFFVTIATVNLTTIDGLEVKGHHCEHVRRSDISAIATVLHTLDTVVVALIIIMFVVLYSHIGKTLYKSQKKIKSFDVPKAQISSSQATSFNETFDETLNSEAVTQNTENKTDEEFDCGSKDLRNTNNCSKQRARMHKLERKMTLISGAMTLGYILSFIPYFGVVLFVLEIKDMHDYELKVGMQILLRTFVFNSAINPYIIGFFNSEFRMYIKEKLCCCKRKKCFK